MAVPPEGVKREATLVAVPSRNFHILIGGGSGIAVPGKTGAGEAAPLWLRPDRLGRAVSVLDIHAIPPPSSPWLEGIHYEARLILLEEDLPEDGEVKKICDDAREGVLD